MFKKLQLKTMALLALLLIGAGSAWAEDGSITININSFSGLPSKATYATYNWTEDGVSGKATIYGSTSATSMQFNASNYLFYSTSALPGKIKSVTMTTASGTNRTYIVYGSTTAYTGSGTSYGTQIGSKTVTTSGTTFTVESGDYTFFTIVKDGSGAGYLSSIVVTYETAAADDAQLSYDETEVTSVPGNNAFVAPTLNNPLSLAVTYSSSDDDMAMVDANTGEVALGDAEGDVTITATTSATGYTKNTSASYIIHLVKGEAELAFATTAFEALPNGDFVAPTLTNPHNLAVTYTSSDANVALVDENTGEILIGEEGTATITATFAGNNSYKAGSASYTITVGKMSAGLSFATTSFNVAIGEAFVAPTLVNPYDLAVTYSTTDPDVADVNASTGAVTIGTKVGTATITASFAGNTQYNAGNASYTITVEKVESTTLTTVSGSQNDGVSNDYFSLTFDKASASNAPAWNDGDAAVRNYAKGTFTVASKNGETIKSITINGKSNSCGGITANPTGTEDLSVSTSITWTAATDDVTSVVFTIGGTKGNYAVKSVDINYYPVEGVVAAPTFSEEAGEVAENTEITLTAADGCTIVYTTDETDPTYAGGAITNGEAYTAPIPVTGPITIKAIAVDASGNCSEVASRSYYLSGETKTEIDMRSSLASITFNAPGANLTGSYQTTTIAMQGSDGNSYTGWQVTNGLKSNTTMQLQSGSGQLVSPTIKSDYGFTIALTCSEGSVTISDGTISATGTLTTTKTETTVTIEASGTTVLTRIVITPLAAPVTISDATDYTPEAKNGVNVTLTRDFVAGWNGIVLPFDLTDDVKTALGATAVKTMGTADYNAGDVTLNFENAELPVAAGTPVLVKLSAAKSSLSVEGVAIKTTAPQTVALTAGGCTYTLKGTYSNVDEEATELYFVSGTKFYHKAAGVALTLKPFRAYIVQEANGAAPARTVKFNLDDENTTGIETINNAQSTMSNEVFDLQGRRVAQPQKGLYIVNGKKVVVK